jgi:hypothetical protein
LGIARHDADVVYVTAECFNVLGIKLLLGDTWPDDAPLSTTRSAVISRKLAAQLFPHEPAVGRLLTLEGERETPILITGVADDARLFTSGGDLPPVLYLNFWQSGHDQWPVFLLKASLNPATLIEPMRRMVRTTGVDYASYIRTLSSQRQMELAQDSLLSFLSSSFAVIALILAAFGVFGLVTFFVNSRRVDMGIRLALGSGRPAILLHVFRRSLSLAVWGLALGVMLSLLLSLLVKHYLYGTTSTLAPLAIATVLALLAVLIATWMPAYRASRLDPNAMLRQG